MGTSRAQREATLALRLRAIKLSNMMKKLYLDFKLFYRQCRAEDFGFYMAAAYIIFSYLRPQSIFPALDIIPWTQICILLGLMYAITKQALNIQKPHIIVLFFCIVCLLSSYYSQYPEISFKNIDVVFKWLVEIIFFTSCIRSISQFRLITILFFLVLFKISFFGARTWVQRGFGFRDFGISGPSGYFENSGELSILMAMFAIMSLAVLFRNPASRRIFFLLPLTAYMTVLAASSRGGQLALLVGSFIFFIAKGKLSIKYLLLAVVIGLTGYSLLPQEQKERFTSAGEDATSQSRLLYWSKGIEMVKDYPILGVGYQSFPTYFHTHYADEISEDTTWIRRREVSHNTYIQVSSEMGLLGLWSYLWMCLIVFKLNRGTRTMLRRSASANDHDWIYQYSIGLDIAQVVFLIGAFFISAALYPYTYFMIMFSLSMNNVVKRELDSAEDNVSVADQA